MHVDKTIPLWLFVDLYGQFNQVKILGKHLPSIIILGLIILCMEAVAAVATLGNMKDSSNQLCCILCMYSK